MGQIFQIICHLKKTKLEYVFISYVGRFNFKTSFTPVNTDMFTVMGPSPGKDNVSFSFTFLISLNLFPSAVYVTMIAYCKCSRFMWLLALSSLGKGKRENVSFCRSVSKVILRLNTNPEDRFSFSSFSLLWWHLISTTKCSFSSQSAVSSWDRWSFHVSHAQQIVLAPLPLTATRLCLAARDLMWE